MNLTTPHRRLLMAIAATALLATSLAIAPFGPQSAEAVPVSVGPLEITSVGSSPSPPGEPGSPLAPGATVLYQLAYNCSGSVADPCEGATLTHEFPTFTDVYGQPASLEWVGWTSVDDWSSPNLSTSGQVTWTASDLMEEGDSGVVIFTLRVPTGIVPPYEQTLPSEATVSLGGATEIADLPDPVIGATSQGATVQKSGSASTSVLRAATSDTVTHVIEICPDGGAAMFPSTRSSTPWRPAPSW